MLLLPCFGATEKIKHRITPIAVMQYSRNPARQATPVKKGLRVPTTACILVAGKTTLKSTPLGCYLYSCSKQVCGLHVCIPPRSRKLGRTLLPGCSASLQTCKKRGDWLLLRGMQHDGDAAHDAQNAPQDAEYVQALLEHQMGQHSAADAADPVASRSPAFKAAISPPSS